MELLTATKERTPHFCHLEDSVGFWQRRFGNQQAKSPTPESFKTALVDLVSGSMTELVRKVQGFLDPSAIPQGLHRKGKRMGTVYLAQIPEANQLMVGSDLTRLLKNRLKGWKGPMPRLC